MKLIKKLLLILAVICLCACTSTKRYVAYTVYPIGYLINRIAGNRVEKISIQDDAIIENASAVDNIGDILKDSLYLFYINGLEPYFEVYGEEIDDSKVTKVDLSVLNTIYKFQRYTLVKAGDVETYIETPYYTGDCFDDIDVYNGDLFLWMDPICMLSMAKDVYNTLSSNYIEQSAYFAENFEVLKNDLVSLDAAYNNLSTKLKNDGQTIKFVSMTPSFGSWQKSYGFQVYPICLSRCGTMPTDEQLEIIKKKIIEDDVKYIVYEPNMTDEMISLFTKLESELSLKRVNLSNLSSLSSSQISEEKNYLSIMYENLSVLENMAVSSTAEVSETDANQ